jgi:hypothetical protein
MPAEGGLRLVKKRREKLVQPVPRATPAPPTAPGADRGPARLAFALCL